MRRKVIRSVTTIASLAVIAAAGLALMAGPAEAKGRKIPCPWPPCLAPCVLGEEPTLICFEKGQAPYESTFGCCCCGSSSPNTRYQPL